jgi:hypothetical protein
VRTDQAKAIPLERLLATLGHTPAHTKGRDLWYLSPFRQEGQPSFKVNTAFNSWYDFGEGKGGNILDFVMAYFRVSSVSAALNELDRIAGLRQSDHQTSMFPGEKPAAASTPPAPPRRESAPTAAGITLKKVQPLQNKALIQYLEQRAIPAAVARPYVQEAYYTVAGRDRTYFALAFRNESGGHELRNPYFQGVAGRKDISLMLPDTPDLFEVVMFEGFLDFISARVKWKDAMPPALVLNSVALKDKAVAAIRAHGFTDVRLYLDRDDSGRRLTGEFLALDGLTVIDASGVYDGFKDFNDWLMGGRQLVRG